MNTAIPIHEAKSNLSKLVKRAKEGETLYIGAFGHPDAILAPVPKQKKKIKYGTMSDGQLDGIDDSVLVGIDPDIQEMFYGKDWNK